MTSELCKTLTLLYIFVSKISFHIKNIEILLIVTEIYYVENIAQNNFVGV